MDPHRSTRTARAPTRIDFGGGWTDVPPYPEERGGRVCSIAIDRHAVITAWPLAEASDAVSIEVERAGEDRLLAAAAAHARVRGVRLALRNDFPVGSGLGGSSAAGVAMQALIAALNGEDADPGSLAELSRKIEVEEMGIAGGRQDHYAAAVGGALDLTFADRVSVRRLTLSHDLRAILPARCLLLHTGESRISGETITAVMDAYSGKDRRVVDALDRMASLAAGMAEALERGDLAALAGMVDEHWSHQRALHPSITTERIEEIFARAQRAGSIGGKALGASGGGCVIVLVPDDEAARRLRESVAGLATELRWNIDDQGVTITAGTS
jgi:D-glycero-alpha-D-manno-heptose-7-phosphate kinase